MERLVEDGTDGVGQSRCSFPSVSSTCHFSTWHIFTAASSLQNNTDTFCASPRLAETFSSASNPFRALSAAIRSTVCRANEDSATAWHPCAQPEHNLGVFFPFSLPVACGSCPSGTPRALFFCPRPLPRAHLQVQPDTPSSGRFCCKRPVPSSSGTSAAPKNSRGISRVSSSCSSHGFHRPQHHLSSSSPHSTQHTLHPPEISSQRSFIHHAHRRRKHNTTASKSYPSIAPTCSYWQSILHQSREIDSTTTFYISPTSSIFPAFKTPTKQSNTSKSF